MSLGGEEMLPAGGSSVILPVSSCVASFASRAEAGPLPTVCRGTSGTLASLDCQLTAVMLPFGGNQQASLGAV